MAITFAIGASPDRVRGDQALLFERELIDYFRSVSVYGGIAAADLIDLDPHGDTLFQGDRLSLLEREVDELLAVFERMFQRTVLPPELEPPEKIGLETEPGGKRCDRTGVLEFLWTLKDLCQEARREGLPLLAIGD